MSKNPASGISVRCVGMEAGPLQLRPGEQQDIPYCTAGQPAAKSPRRHVGHGPAYALVGRLSG